MKKTFFILSFITVLSGNSQVLQVDNSLTPQQLVEDILSGSGVQITNIVFTGDNTQVGSFNGAGTNIGFNSGIILNSGNIQNAIGPNNTGSAGNTAGGGGDADLSQIVNGDQINDAAILEFDFVPIDDTIIFNFVFASEEYLEWVGSFNDVFGFFISGPGINGPYSNNSENIALIPGTTNPVSINNVNDATNSSFYVDNENPPGESIQYDGFTVPMQAVRQVQCGLTYHLKIAIGDAVDGSYDSGVFLEAGSLSSIGANITLQTVTGSSTIFEGCTNADFIFSRPVSQINDPLTVNYTFSGTAIEGVDYIVTPPGTSITFPVGEDTVLLTLSTIGIIDANEGNESVIINANFTTQCGSTVTLLDSLIITEEPVIDAITNDLVFDCPRDSAYVTVAALSGTPPYNYIWVNAVGDTVEFSNDSLFINLNTVGTQTFNIHITDFCGFEFDTVATITLNAKPPLSLSASAPNANCLTPTVPLTAVGSGGLAPLTYLWSNGEIGPVVDGITTGNPPPTYTVTMTDACGDTMQASVTIVFDPGITLDVNAIDVTVQCPNQQVPITASVSNGFSPYFYTWSTNETTQTINVAINTNGTETYTVNVIDNCGNIGSTTVDVTLNQTLNIAGFDSISTYLCAATGAASAAITGQTGNVNYTWSGPNSDTVNVTNSTSISSLTTGWYYLTIVDDVCNDEDSVFIGTLENPTAAFIYTEPVQDPPKNILFINQSQNATNFIWDFGNGDTQSVNDLNNVSSTYSDIITYTITLIAFNGPCSDTTTQTITILAEPNVISPNVFSPDGDTKNDLFFFTAKNVEEFSYQIYNRWGNLIFEGDLSKPTWDGKTSSGKEANEGVYFYVYKGTGYNGTKVEGQGNIQLTR